MIKFGARWVMRYMFGRETPLCKVYISESGSGVDGLYFGEYDGHCEVLEKETNIIQKAFSQLDEYFNGSRISFDLPLDASGTVFQKSVWQALLNIPYGETRSYKEIAEIVGVPKGYRAVGMANNKNPIGIFIPCHRVVGHNGNLVGYAGGLALKQFLLELEKVNIKK